MGRGGIRIGAGRKTTWTSGRKHADTTVIRVPREFAAQLLEMAHKLDAGENIESAIETKKELVTKSEAPLDELRICIARWREKMDRASLKNNHWVKARVLIPEIENILSNENQVSENDIVTESLSLSTRGGLDSVTESAEFISDVVLESVTESKMGDQLSLLDIVTESKEKPAVPPSLSASELAARLNNSVPTLTKYKNGQRTQTLGVWSRTQDPQGFGWWYDSEKKRYFPIA